MGGGEHKNRLGGDIERGGGSGWGGDRKSGVELGTLTGIETVGERKKSGRKAEEKRKKSPVSSRLTRFKVRLGSYRLSPWE